jgi:hypothetical protein
MTDVYGYLIKDCGCSGGVWEYLPVHQCRGHCMGEAVLVRGGMFGAHAISREYSRAFAEWRTMSAFADRQRIADGPVDPYKSVDAYGLELAVRLRDEIGAGPMIVFEKRERNRCGGPHAWKVSDDGGVTPYFHAPHVGYVIDPSDDCGAWAWQYCPASRYLENGVVGSGDRWSGEVEIPEGLIDYFSLWQQKWARVDFAAAPEDCSDEIGDFSWSRFHDQGIRLTRLLKRFVGARYTVIYSRAHEDLSWSSTDFFYLELRSDGSTRGFDLHWPYWSKTA